MIYLLSIAMHYVVIEAQTRSRRSELLAREGAAEGSQGPQVNPHFPFSNSLNSISAPDRERCGARPGRCASQLADFLRTIAAAGPSALSIFLREEMEVDSVCT